MKRLVRDRINSLNGVLRVDKTPLENRITAPV
jgi:hypothetical protein